MIVARQSDFATAKSWLEMCIGRGDTSGGIISAKDLAAGALIIVFSEGGKDCGAMALDFFDRAGGRVCFVNAAGGRRESGQSLLPEMITVAEKVAKQMGVAQICFDTRRPGLIRKMAENGFRQASVQMVKDLKNGK